jgi:uncharacterized metal-binding protein
MLTPSCAHCTIKSQICRQPEGTAPEGCPTETCADSLEDVLGQYDAPETHEFALQASRQEGEGYSGRGRQPFVLEPCKCRLEETVDFCRRMGFQRLGLAFCAGLSHEARKLCRILERHGFTVVGVSCKVGGVPKERLGLRDDEKIRAGQHETMCNPILQATVLNRADTEFNLMVGLCVGHDALFLKHVDSPTSVFAVKDRVTGHNPLAALYTSRSYYQRLGEVP